LSDVHVTFDTESPHTRKDTIQGIPHERMNDVLSVDRSLLQHSPARNFLLLQNSDSHDDLQHESTTMNPTVGGPSSRAIAYHWWLKHSEPADDDEELISAFHAHVRLADSEALLVDTGAIGNLAGSNWVQRVQKICRDHGQGVSTSDISKPLTFGGVGSGESTCRTKASVPLAFEDGRTGMFESPIVGESELPALLGLQSMDSRRTVLDLVNNLMYEMGPGNFSINPSPGARILKMRRAPTGHLMLPISEWRKVTKPGKQLTYLDTVVSE